MTYFFLNANLITTFLKNNLTQYFRCSQACDISYCVRKTYIQISETRILKDFIVFLSIVDTKIFYVHMPSKHYVMYVQCKLFFAPKR